MFKSNKKNFAAVLSRDKTLMCRKTGKRRKSMFRSTLSEPAVFIKPASDRTAPFFANKLFSVADFSKKQDAT